MIGRLLGQNVIGRHWLKWELYKVEHNDAFKSLNLSLVENNITMPHDSICLALFLQKCVISKSGLLCPLEVT